MGCLVWRTCSRMAPAALVRLAAALAPTHPASDQVLPPTRPATKTMTAPSLSWTRSLKTTTPIRTRCRAREGSRGGLGRFNPKPPLENHHGDPEMTGVAEAPSITHGGSLPWAIETLFDHSPTHSCSRCDTQTRWATLRLPAEGVADLTPARTAPSVSPTPPTSADTCYATQESDCIHVSFVTRASSLPPSSLCTPARTRGSGLSAALSVVNVLPGAATWELTSGMCTWGRGPLPAQSAGRDLPTGGTWGCTITESIKEIPTTRMNSRSPT